MMRTVLSNVAAIALILSSPAKADNGLVTVCPRETMAWVLIHMWEYEPIDFSRAYEYFFYGRSAQRQSCRVMSSDVFDLSEGLVVGVKIVKATTSEHKFHRELVMAEVELNGSTEYALFER